MNIRSRKALHQHAQQRLADAPGNPRLIALIYAGILCATALGCTIFSDILSSQISETGGLSNMGLRSILSTIQYILPILQLIVMLSLELGYCKVALNLSRAQQAEPRTLLEGLRRFGPMLRAVLLQVLILVGICIGATYLSSFIFMMLPVSADFMELATPLVESMSVLDTELVMDEATMMTMTEAMIPMLWIFAAIFAVIAVPLLYSFRMVNYWLLDMGRPGALGAMKLSRMIMRRNRFALFRLDLSFWWYYLLLALADVVAYGDLLLPMLGISLPWSGTFSYYIFYVVSLALQLILHYFFLNRVQVTYAAAFDALKLQFQPPQSPQYPAYPPEQ